jgi:hypothetical protein
MQRNHQVIQLDFGHVGSADGEGRRWWSEKWTSRGLSLRFSPVNPCWFQGIAREGANVGALKSAANRIGEIW